MRMSDLTKVLRPLRNALANLVARAVVQLVNDSGGLQGVQLSVLDGETREGVERFQEYGFTSSPRPGAEAVVLFVGGRRDHGLVVAVDDRRYRLTSLSAGEVALYNDAGARVHLKADGTVELANPASDAVLKGTAYKTAEHTFLDALSVYAVAIQGVADPGNAATPTLTAAITAFKAAITAALSAKVKVG